MLFVDSVFYGTHSLTHSLTYSLLLTHSLLLTLLLIITHSLTHSLTHPFAGVFFSDTGTCESLVIEELCLSLQNDIFHKSQCQWSPSTKAATGGTCSLAPPPTDYLFFAVLSVIISLIGVFFAVMYKVLAVYIMANQPDWKRLPFYDFASCIFYDPYYVNLAVGGSTGSSKAAKKAFLLNKRNKKINEIEDDIEEVVKRYSHAYSLTHSLTHSYVLTHTYSLTITYSLTHLLTYSLTYLLIHSLTHSLITLGVLRQLDAA